MYGSASREMQNARMSLGQNNVFGVGHVKGGGTIRLLYLSTAAVILVGLRTLLNSVLAHVMVLDHTRWFSYFGFVDLLVAGIGLFLAIQGVQRNSVARVGLSAATLLLGATYSFGWLGMLVMEMVHAWAICAPKESETHASPMPGTCKGFVLQLNDHGVLLLVLAIHTAIPAGIVQFAGLSMACSTMSHIKAFLAEQGRTDSEANGY